jgi:adenylate kinase
MLRSEVKLRSSVGQRAAQLMDKGDLIPDDLVMEMVGTRLSERDTTGRGFVLDGCPRTTNQAESLEKLVVPFGLDLVIDLQVPTSLVMKRLASRRVCVDCGANYSTAAPPLVNWTCDVCGGEVVQRPDDTEEAIGRRLNLYEEETAPLGRSHEAQRGRAGQNAPRRKGGGRNARGHPSRCQARRDHGRTGQGRPRGARAP